MLQMTFQLSRASGLFSCSCSKARNSFTKKASVFGNSSRRSRSHPSLCLDSIWRSESNKNNIWITLDPHVDWKRPCFGRFCFSKKRRNGFQVYGIYIYIYIYIFYIICKYILYVNIYIYRHDYICIAIFGNAISWCLQFSLRFSWHSPFVHNKNPDLQMFPTKESITFYQGAFALQVPCNWIGKMVTTTRWDKKRQREKVIWCEKKVIANVHL